MVALLKSLGSDRIGARDTEDVVSTAPSFQLLSDGLTLTDDLSRTLSDETAFK